MEKVTKYKLPNGVEVTSKQIAELGEQITNITGQIKELNNKLRELKGQCNCEYKTKYGSPIDCGVKHTTQPYLCEICGHAWYHHIEADEWYKWQGV